MAKAGKTRNYTLHIHFTIKTSVILTNARIFHMLRIILMHPEVQNDVAELLEVSTNFTLNVLKNLVL